MIANCNCEKCELKDLFFENVGTIDIEAMCNNKIEKKYKKGSVIVEKGQTIKDFIYLKEGLVKLFRISSSGKEQIITISKPLDFVNLLSVFSDSEYNYSVVSLIDSTTCILDFKQVKELIKTNASFSMGLLRKMSSISDKIILQSIEIRQRHLHGRVAFILLYFANKVFYSHEFDLPISRKEIAEFIGMTTENVIRTLSEFRKDKIIKIYGKLIEIIDMKKMEQISLHG